MIIVPATSSRVDVTPLEDAVDQLTLRVAAPATVQRLLKLLEAPATSWRDIEKVLGVDAGLVTRVLRLASTVEFAARPVRDIRAALQYLGTDQLRRLVLAAYLGGSGSVFGRALWAYSLRTAITCQALARVGRLTRGPDPFLCGLLHDLGTSIMEQLFGARYTSLGFVPGDEAQVAQERAAFGFDHTDLGAMAASRWMLFPELELVAQLHHDPGAAATLALPTATVQAIELVALSRLVSGPDDESTRVAKEQLCQRLDVTPVAADACGIEGGLRAAALVEALR